MGISFYNILVYKNVKLIKRKIKDSPDIEDERILLQVKV